MAAGILLGLAGSLLGKEHGEGDLFEDPLKRMERKEKEKHEEYLERCARGDPYGLDDSYKPKKPHKFLDTW